MTDLIARIEAGGGDVEELAKRLDTASRYYPTWRFDECAATLRALSTVTENDVERVAKALCRRHWIRPFADMELGDLEVDDVVERDWPLWEDDARAALTAFLKGAGRG